jgi:hypothetical protein
MQRPQDETRAPAFKHPCSLSILFPFPAKDDRIMSRWKAAAIHLTISATIGLVVGALLFGVWYPPPYFHAAGADVLVLLLVSVDLTLGPLLTLVVFKSGKRGLKFDLAVIAIAQAIALVYGMSVVLKSRPVFLLAVIDRFELIAASDIAPADLAEGSAPEFRSLSWTGPRLAAAEKPKDWRDRNKILFGKTGGKDIDVLPKYYVDYASAAPDLLKRAKPLDALPLRGEKDRDALDKALSAAHAERANVVWVPIVARKASLTMLLDVHTGRPVRAIAVHPW